MEFGIGPVRLGDSSILSLVRKERPAIAGEMEPERLARPRLRTRPERHVTPGQEQQLVAEVQLRISGLPKPALSLRRAFFSALWQLSEETRGGKQKEQNNMMVKMMLGSVSFDMIVVVLRLDTDKLRGVERIEGCCVRNRSIY